MPEGFPDRPRLFPDAEESIDPGDSVLVAPSGKIVAGPLSKPTGILYADVDAERCTGARRSLDVAGHDARPGVFDLRVHRGLRQPLAFD